MKTRKNDVWVAAITSFIKLVLVAFLFVYIRHKKTCILYKKIKKLKYIENKIKDLYRFFMFKHIITLLVKKNCLVAKIRLHILAYKQQKKLKQWYYTLKIKNTAQPKILKTKGNWKNTPKKRYINKTKHKFATNIYQNISL